MAITFIKDGGTAANKAPAGTANTVTVPAGGHALGNTVVVAARGEAGGAATVTDSRSNTYTLLSGANENILAASVLTTALLAADTITVTWTTTPTEMWICTKEFAGLSITEDVADAIATGASTTPSVTITPTSAETLMIAGLNVVGPSGDVFTEDTDTTGGAGWTGLRIGTTGGGATSNVTGNFAHKITTSAAAQVYNPVLGTSRDWTVGLGSLRPIPSAGLIVPIRPGRGLYMRGKR